MGIKETPKRPYKGWHNDNSPNDQPEGTYRHLWNGILQTHIGDKHFVVNEMANSLCVSIPENYKPIGKVYLGEDQIIIFSTDNIRSEIGILDRDCTYETIVNSECLNFQISNQIDAVFRLRSGCERTIYFTDNINPVRYFNFDKQSDFFTDEFTEFGTGEKWNCELFNLFLGFTVPCFTSVNILEQGNLKSGSYNFAIQYLDQDLNPTKWAYTSQVVPIFRSKLSETYRSILGSSNAESDDLGGVGSATNKSIVIGLGSLDPKYAFYRIAVIEATGFTGLVTNAYVSAATPTSQTEFTYDGNLQGFTNIAVEEIILQPELIDVAEHIEQIENRLILSNVKGKQVRFCDFQKYASRIGSKYVVRNAPANSIDLGNPKDPNTYWERLGYMGDEVYAMGIVYVFKDGDTSPAYHIPGAPKDHRIDPATNGCVEYANNDSQLITVWSEDVAHIYATPAEMQDIEKWKVFNTAISTSAESGHLAYWETDNFVYSSILDCDDKDYWGNDFCANPLVNTPIRHHKFPNRNLVPQYESSASSQYEVTLRVKLTIDSGAPLDPLLGPYELIVNYEIDGTPYSQTIDIDATLFDTNGFSQIYTIVVAQVSSPLDASILSFTGNIGIDPTFSKDDVSYSSQGQVAIVGTTTINQLGIQFFNIQYPHPDIVGHYFVRAERDSVNKTILDKGISNPLHESSAKGQDFTVFDYFNGGPVSSIGGPIINRSEKYNYFFTPELHFNNNPPDGAFISQENEFGANSFSLLYGNKDTGTEFDNRTEFAPAEGGAVFGKTYATLISTRVQGYYGLVGTGNKNRSIEKSIVLNGLTVDEDFTTPVTKLFNVSHTNRIHVGELSSSLAGAGRNLPYIALKVNRDVFGDILNIKYFRTHNCILDLTNTQIVFGGDTHISRWDISNTLYFQFHQSVWDEVLIGIGIVVAAIAVVFTAGASAAAIAGLLGAVGVSAAAAGIQTAIIVTAIVAAAVGVTATQITAIIESYRSTGLMEVVTEDAELQSASFSTKNFIEYANEHISNLYVESTINIALRQDHIIYDGGEFYREQRDIREYFRDKIMYFDPEETAQKRQYKLRGAVLPEVYHYNLDFSRLNEESIYFPIPTSFNCCSPCVSSHPSRVHYSQQSFQEESIDNYRVFLSQNYRDIEGEHGVITNIFRLKNNLYIHTKEALWLLPQNIQERVTGDVVAFIGTGEYFSIPPRLVIDDQLGSAGTQDKWAYMKNSFGAFFVDQLNSTVYHISGDGSLKSINTGISSWLENNLRPFLDYQFYTTTKTHYPFVNNPANPQGVGIHLSFDTWFERLILTKRDYLCIRPFSLGNSDPNGNIQIFPGEIKFDIRVNKWIIGTTGNDYVEIFLEDPEYFENKSFTISYSFENQSWVGQHSYIPLMYMRSPSSWYSFKDNDIWRHNKIGEYNKYYGITYDHILEYVSLTNPIMTRVWQHIRLLTEAKKYSLQDKQYYDVRDTTWNRAILYNSRQCSGELILVVKTETATYLHDQVVQSSNQNVIISRNERDWTFNDFADYRSEYLTPIWTNDWSSVQSEYPIDKVLRPGNINFDKNWYEMEEFRDKYLIIRLKLTNLADTQLITNYGSELEEDSFR